MQNRLVMRLAVTVLLGMGVVGGGSEPAWSDGNSSTVPDATASARVITPLELTSTNDLRFGNLAPTGTAGTVTLATNGTRSAANVGLVTTGAFPGIGAAAFLAQGEAGATVNILLPTTIDITKGLDMMPVDLFMSLPTGSGVLAAGILIFNVGATLHVGATQPPGQYAGTFDVTVQYP